MAGNTEEYGVTLPSLMVAGNHASSYTDCYCCYVYCSHAIKYVWLNLLGLGLYILQSGFLIRIFVKFQTGSKVTCQLLHSQQ